MRNRKLMRTAAAFAAALTLTMGSGMNAAAAGGPIMIASQGIFSAGGITVTSEGTFNPEDHWEDGKSVANPGSQFPNDDATINQFFRQMTPDTGMTSDMGSDFDTETVARAAAAAIDEVYKITGKKRHPRNTFTGRRSGLDGGSVHRPYRGDHCH